ncbi:MAG: type II toxin-antitoxin system HicA family toxin [Candidatus Bipolaricaulia bacterium]
MILPRTVTARRFIKALLKDGFVLVRQKGSHQTYRHPDGRTVTVLFHRSGETFRPGTLHAMIKDAGWTEADLRRLKLIK